MIALAGLICTASAATRPAGQLSASAPNGRSPQSLVEAAMRPSVPHGMPETAERRSRLKLAIGFVALGEIEDVQPPEDPCASARTVSYSARMRSKRRPLGCKRMRAGRRPKLNPENFPTI